MNNYEKITDIKIIKIIKIIFYINNYIMNKIILIIILIIVIILLYLEIYLFDSNKYIFENKCIININIYNTLHLGDHIYNTYYFNFIQDYIEKNKIKINYHIDSMYHDQVKEFITSKNIKILDLKYIGLNMSILNLSYNNNYFYHFIIDYINRSKLIYDKFYLKLFNETSEKLGFPIKMNEFIYTNEQLLIQYNKLDQKYKDIDILVINSIPRTSQIIVDINEWNEFINKLVENKFKVVTTLKVPNITCTLDDNLSVFNIGAISTHAKIIIAINTGPTASIFNNYTLGYTKQIYIFDDRVTFTHEKVIHVDKLSDIKIDQLKKFIL